jgi:hypothetical protein
MLFSVDPLRSRCFVLLYRTRCFPGVLFVAVREIARCIISFAMVINTSFVQLCYGEDKVLSRVLQTTMGK